MKQASNFREPSHFSSSGPDDSRFLWLHTKKIRFIWVKYHNYESNLPFGISEHIEAGNSWHVNIKMAPLQRPNANKQTKSKMNSKSVYHKTHTCPFCPEHKATLGRSSLYCNHVQISSIRHLNGDLSFWLDSAHGVFYPSRWFKLYGLAQINLFLMWNISDTTLQHWGILNWNDKPAHRRKRKYTAA